MPQQSFTVVENTFVNGLVTEATGLNFPDKACSDTYDCVFDIDGSVVRRNGFDLETNFSTKNINRNNSAMKTYLWQDVSGDGNTTVVVVQVGPKLYFYETNGTGIFSTGAQTTSVSLTAVAGAPVVDTVECQFTDGNGFLVVTHPYCEPMLISYDVSTHTATPTNIILQVRDFAGDSNDPYAVDERPTATLATLNVHHYYNLLNQGWNTTNLTTWDTAQTTMPSNADVMWRFVDTSNNFTASSTTIASVVSGNSPAPNGHYIMPLANQDRNTASGLTGLPVTTTSFQRPTCCAFFAGRIFYAGINYTGFNSNIYFTQILENSNEYGNCYQVNDPTSADLFDVLPSDGGVIAIPEAGTVYKMQTVPGGLCVFAANGVWFVTGSTGLGFTATDYAIVKIADIGTISDTSFVNVNGFPVWWNSDGIYMMVNAQGNTIPVVQSLTYTTFKTFFDNIPVPSKRFARGYFDKTNQQIRWIYRSTATTTVNETYEYDTVLNYNMRTNAFYPWTISASPVKVHSILSSELVTHPININNVVDSLSDNVVDSLGNQVISFSVSGNDAQQVAKYLVSYPDNAGSYNITFGNQTDTTFIDWFSFDNTGVNYTSYAITGFKLRGSGIRKFQSNWVDVFSRLNTPVSYKFQAIWDYANTGTGTGRWSTNQLVSHSDTNYNNAMKRLKVRGHGKAMQFRISSVLDNPFDIIGWTSLQTVNGAP